MTDQPATTPAADRVTALTLRCGQLREQRDQARADLAQTQEDLGTCQDAYTAQRRRSDKLRTERDEARAQARQLMAATTDADDLRARVEALHHDAGGWCEHCYDPPTYTWPCPTAAAIGPRPAETGPQAPESPQTTTNTTAVITGPQIGAEGLGS